MLTKKKLTIPELNKENKRWETFLNKLKNDSPFIIQNEGEVIVTNPHEIIKNITNSDGNIGNENVVSFLRPKNRYSPVIKTNKGNFKLNQFNKTIEFGGGTGSSLGTINARIYETIQAIFFSLRQYLGRDIEPSDLHLLYQDNINNVDSLSDSNLKEILSNVKSRKSITIDDLKYFENKGWIYTYIKTANVFYNSLNKDKKYIFHHAYSGEGIADAIYEAFARCIKPINKENNIRVSMSRWNPSDIWAVDADMEKEIIEVLNDCKDMIHLNTIIDSLFEQNYFIGISLKKIPFDREIQLIVSKTLHTNFIYDYTSASKDEFDTMTVQIHSKSFSWLGHKRKESLESRIFTGKYESNILLEINGSVSKYGKSSLIYINHVLNKLGVGSIPTYKDIKLSDDQLRYEIKRLYKKIPNLYKVSAVSNKFNIEDIRSKLISKYQSLLLIEKLEKFKKKPYNKSLLGRLKFLFNRKLSMTNYIIKEIFYYGYSMGGDLFDTCKFYRIKTH
jgi:hypothetical protein